MFYSKIISGPSNVVYISGGMSGIGLCLAKYFIAQGCHVALLDMQQDAGILMQLREMTKNPKQQINAYEVDISSAEQTKMICQLASEEIGRPDLAVNSAGILRTGLFTDLSYDTFQNVINVNLTGSRNFAAAVLPHMRANSHLVLVASLAGIVGTYTQSAYAASKFGVIGLAEVLRLELKPRQIHVSVICPGEIKTPLLETERQQGNVITKELNEFAGVITVEQAVAGMVKGINKREFMITPGFKAKLTRFLMHKFPRVFRKIMDFKLKKAMIKHQTE